MSSAIRQFQEESSHPEAPPFVSRQLKSSLKSHCVAGPKSPKRISAKVAAVPPPIREHALDFYNSLKEEDLANPQLREHLGELSQELALKNSIDRSADKLLSCNLNSNAAAELGKLRAKFCDRGRADSGITRDKVLKKSRSIRISRSTEVSGGADLRGSTSKVSPAAMVPIAKAPKERKKSRASRHVKKSTEPVVQLRPHARSVRGVRKTPARDSGSS